MTFPQFAKIEVNGEGADPLFAYLQQQKGFEGFDDGHELTPILEDLLSKDDPDYAASRTSSGTSRSSSSTARATSCAVSSHRVHPRRRGTRRGGAAVAFSARTYLAQAHEARTREPGRRIHRDAAFFCASECFT